MDTIPQAKEIVARLRRKNPSMSSEKLIELLCEHIDAVESYRSLHGFLVSGYADGIKYCEPEPDDECECPKDKHVQAGDCPAGRWWWECSLCGKKVK